MRAKQQLIRVGITHGEPFYKYVFEKRFWRKKETHDGGAEFVVVPWSQISIDNAAGRSEVPFTGKNGLGVVHRTPDCWFSAHQTVFDRDPRYFSATRRNRNLLWI